MIRNPHQSNTAQFSVRPRAYSYVRFSSPEQARGESFRRQLEGARKYAIENDLDLDESFRDAGVSAFKGKNRDEKAALGAFLKHVERGDVPPGSYLLIESLDRLSREQVLDALALFLSLIAAGIIIVTLGDHCREYSRSTLDNDTSQLLISISVMTRAHEESVFKGLRVADAWARKRGRAREDLQAMTARCPAWLRLVGGPRHGRYEIIGERAEEVRRWFADTIAGLGRRAIAKRLNAEKLPTWGTGKSNGKIWYDSYIHKTLTNPAVFGTFTPRGKLAGGSDATAEGAIANFFPKIVEEETFWRANAASQARGSGNGRPGSKHRNLLRGLAKCAACGSNMIFLNKGVRPRAGRTKLRCGRAHLAAECDHRETYDYLAAEVSVVWGLGTKRTSLIAEAVNHASEVEISLAAASAREDAARKELGNLISLVQAGGVGPTVAGRVVGLEAEIVRLASDADRLRREFNQAKIADPARDIAGIEDIYAALDKCKGDDRVRARASLHEKLCNLIETVIIGPDGMLANHKDGGGSRTIRVGSP